MNNHLTDGFMESLSLETQYSLYQQYLVNLQIRNDKKLIYLKARHGNRSYAGYTEKPLEFDKFQTAVLPFMIVQKLLNSQYSSWFSELTLEQIAELIGISRERVRQILDRATSKLSNNKIGNYREQWEEFKEIIEQSYVSYDDNDESLIHLPNMET